MSTLRQAPMICIPIKPTDEVDLSQPLRAYIRSNYGQNDYSEECLQINRMRQDMRSATKDSPGRDLLYKYYGQLELLELRFPVNEEHIRISFTWYDAFTDIAVSQYSMAYEKACVVFNIAAVLSSIALAQTRSELEGMRKAYHNFQAAAGLMNFINDNFLHAPSIDLSREMVKTLSFIMLAQAQEVFTEKQIADLKKPSIVAKLGAEVASLYHNANESLGEMFIAGHIDKAWSSYCIVKEKYWTSQANYRQGLADEAAEKIGQAVARLSVASTLANQALKSSYSCTGELNRHPSLSNDPGSAMNELLKSHAETVSAKLISVRKENDMIYHEAVPKENALLPVAKLPSAKAIPLQDLYAGKDIGQIIGSDIFHKLVPLAVHESASIYTEEIAKMLRNEQEKCDIADSELSTCYEYLGLPKSLHQFKVTEEQRSQDLSSAPSTLQNIAVSISSQDRLKPLAQHIQDMQVGRQQVEAALQKAARLLDEEERSCELMRNQNRETWTQQPSNQHNHSMRAELSSYQQSMNQASQSDANMISDYERIRSSINILKQGQDGVTSAFSKIIQTQSRQTQNSDEGFSLLDLEDSTTTQSKDDEIAIKVDQVDEILRQLNLVKKERVLTLNDLKDRARKDDISDVLVLNKKVPGMEARIFASELEKFKPHQLRIDATIARQEQLIEEMTSTYKHVLDNKPNQEKLRRWELSSQQRNVLIKDLEDAATAYNDLSEGSARAAKFYNELTRLATDLVQNCQAFVRDRQNEGRKLLQGVGSKYQTPMSNPRATNDVNDSLRHRLEALKFDHHTG